MKGLLVLSILALCICLSLGDICPPPEVLHPCTCMEEGESIICRQVDFNVKGVFDRASEYVNDEVTFIGLFIQNISITEIEDGAIEHLKFNWITIYGNDKLEYISPLAFNATRGVTTTLQMSANNFSGEGRRALVELVNGFEKLQNLYILHNNLTSIPSNAFQNMSDIQVITLERNNISSIGSHAFATGTDNLTRLHLAYNSVPSEGLPQDAFEDISLSAVVHLECNGMDFLEQNSFQTLFNRAANVTVGGVNCQGNDVNATETFYCDGRADWLCDNEDSYRPKLWGFLCKNETGFEDVWEYCGNRTTAGEMDQLMAKLE